jgi:hypothetical protein
VTIGDASADLLAGGTWSDCGRGAKPAVSASEFCDRYSASCPGSFGAGKTKYANQTDCLKRYGSFATTGKGCAAYHLCLGGEAGRSPATAAMECAAAAGGGSNPCKLPGKR